MSIYVLSLVFFICSVFAEINEKSNLTTDCVEGYYWREYTGDVPRDALPGGLDANGLTIYIGQVLANTRLYPGQIREAEKSVIYFDVDHTQHTAKTNIKILCGYHSGDFDWIKTNNSNIRTLTDKHLISGGHFDINYTVYIGRLSINGEILVGMILDCNTNEFGLHIVKDGKATTYDSYEVLSYNPKIRVPRKHEAIPNADSEEKCAKNIIKINIY